MNRRNAVTLLSLVMAGAMLTAQQPNPSDTVARIRAEGLQRSSALRLFRAVTDDIGPRLTGSPAHVGAAKWALQQFTDWGLTNPHLEAYEFGRGWELDEISVEMTEPRYQRLIAYPDAWSPPTAGAVSGR